MRNIVNIFIILVVLLCKGPFCAGEDDILSSLDKYRQDLNSYIELSNKMILEKIKEVDVGKKIEGLDKLRVFNINLEICRDFQILSERYVFYLAWLLDLYRIKHEGPNESITLIVDKSISELEGKILTDLTFDIENYFPSFLPDITDPDILQLGKSLLASIEGLGSLIKSK